jgi:hypothetical protein
MMIMVDIMVGLVFKIRSCIIVLLTFNSDVAVFIS